MRMIKYLKVAILFLPVFFYAQNTKVIILDNLNHNPLNGIQIFSENGSFIGNSNSKGEFEFDGAIFQQSNIKNIMIYDSNYSPVEYKIEEVPSVVYLEKIRHYELEPVVIVKKLSEKYFTLKGYVRSWQLVNNKLVKYGDGLMEYHVPYENTNNDFVTGIKNYALENRTFKADSIKQKSRIIRFSFGDSYLNYLIPRRDQFARGWKKYKSEQKKDSLFIIHENGKNVGYFVEDKKNNVATINVNESFEGENAIKILFWKFSGSYSNTEKWVGTDDTRHLSYSFSSEKKMVETKTKGKFNAVETITEVFIDDKIVYNDKKPRKSKTFIDKDRSFYNTEYWKEEIKKHPLPSAIIEQLKNIKENKNNY